MPILNRSTGKPLTTENVVRRRYESGLRNFFDLYIPLAESWVCYDNSGAEARCIAHKGCEESPVVEDAETWRVIREMAG